MTASAMRSETAAPRSQSAALRSSARRHITVALAVTAAGALALAMRPGAGVGYAATTIAIAVCGAAAVWAHLPGRHPYPSFGAANAMTLARGVVVAWIAGLIACTPEVGGAWAGVFAVIGGTAVAILDGVDGHLARRDGVASTFGARFDMETDALLILALSALAWRWDRAGVWVLASGLARYAFVGAGYALPFLRQPLAPSRRRQTICVIQIIVLLTIVAPLLPRTLTPPLALLALIMLLASFAVDVVALARAARQVDSNEVARC